MTGPADPTDPAAWYDARAAVLADVYEAIAPERLHGWLDGLLPVARSLVLDVGAGSGRDAAWLAGLGHDVVAVEPSPALRAEALRHPAASVRRVGDRLPALPATLRLGLAFDAILPGAVWQRVVPAERARALPGWSAGKLARDRMIGVDTILRAEVVAGEVRMTVANARAVQKSLEEAWVESIPEDGGGGVRMREPDRPFRPRRSGRRMRPGSASLLPCP